MDDEEEACTPRADEATPLQDKPKRPRRRLALGACATLALGAVYRDIIGKRRQHHYSAGARPGAMIINVA